MNRPVVLTFTTEKIKFLNGLKKHLLKLKVIYGALDMNSDYSEIEKMIVTLDVLIIEFKDSESKGGR